MSQIHEFKCDACKRKVTAKYNGEHFLPPDGWVQLYCDNLAEMTGEHICDKCRPKKTNVKRRASK